MKKIICVDVDGTLNNETCFTEKECLKATPVRKNIRKVNRLYQENFIIIWTARRNELISATLEWLGKCNIRFHAISNCKVPFDVYLDAKGGMDIEDI